MSNYIDRPKKVEGFAEEAMQGDYLPVKFGTNIVTKMLDKIANKNFKYGLESLEKDFQLKDLNTLFFYYGQLNKYLFERGVAEFSAYQDYPVGAVVSYENDLWIATQEHKSSLRDVETSCNPCNPCEPCNPSVICGEPKNPSKENGWCKLVTHCQYDTDIATIQEALSALQTTIKSLKGVVDVGIIPNSAGELEFTINLSDDSKKIIKMDKFGSIKKNENDSLSIINPDGTKLELPKFVASSELDQTKGFFWNNQSNKWEVDLNDLVKSGSGLEVDKNGTIFVKPSDLIDIGKGLEIDENSGNIIIDPEYIKKISNKINDKIAEGLKENQTNTDNKIKELKDQVDADITALQNQVNTLNNTIGALGTNITTLGNDITTLRAELKAFINSGVTITDASGTLSLGKIIGDSNE